MAFKKVSLKIASHVVIMTILAATVWMSERHSITIEVECNGTQVTWNKTILNKKAMQYKTMSLAVRSLLEKDLKNVKGVTDITVEKFLKIHSENGTFCEFEFKSDVGKEIVEKKLNRSLEIGMEKALISHRRLNISLPLPGVEWKDTFADHNRSEYRNIAIKLEDVLNDFYQDTDNFVDFEVISLTKGNDGWTLAKVEHFLLVSSAFNATGKESQYIPTAFIKSDTYGKTFPDAKWKQELKESDIESDKKDKDNQRSTLTVSLIVIAAMAICAVMIVFLVAVIRQNWKYIKEHAPEVLFESYQKRRNKTKPKVPEKAQEETKTTAVDNEDCNVVVDSFDNPIASES